MSPSSSAPGTARKRLVAQQREQELRSALHKGSRRDTPGAGVRRLFRAPGLSFARPSPQQGRPAAVECQRIWRLCGDPPKLPLPPQVSECSLFSGSSSQTLKEVSCESCLCPVADPITPACNHSFCRVCVARSWSCPTCKPVPKATLWSPAVVFGELRELCDITKAEPDPEELEPHCTIHGSASPDSCHDEARCTCIHVTHAEELWDPIWGFSYRTKPPTSFQKVKEIVRTERAKMLSEYRSLRMLVQERKSLNISRLDSMLHSIVRKERKALRDQHDSFTSIFSSIRLSKQIERCLHGRADATYHQADIGPTLSASTNKKERTCLRVGKKKMSSSSSDSDLGAEGPVYYGGSMKGSTTLWKKSTLSNTPWLPHEPEWSYASAFPSGTSM
ncbi:E3 ubiquitin-protein ligase TRIM39-like isoform X3 [Pleurodeles waltl]|uniref:E3 ubiquitin-protein ligase TRIM39-like isoform X3 n=1 Tax=Pleurodeles waltl TaxID=8319 RepID=UPI0037095452